MTEPCCDYRDHGYEFDPIAQRIVASCACECHDTRCPSLYGPEQIRCTQRANEPHEWHTGSGIYPDDEPFGTPGDVYGAAWLSHWEPAS